MDQATNNTIAILKTLKFVFKYKNLFQALLASIPDCSHLV